MRFRLTLLLTLLSTPLAAQGFCSDLTGPELDRCRVDYYESANASLGIVYRRAMEGLAPAAQARLRAEQTAWVARRTRLSGVTRPHPVPAAAKLDTLISLTESRIDALGQQALARAPWLIGILPGGAGSGDSLDDVIAMRNDVWRFASWQEGWVHAGHDSYAGQDDIKEFHPTTGHAITVLIANADGWSAIVTSDASGTLCGMFRGVSESQDPNLVEEGKVTCW